MSIVMEKVPLNKSSRPSKRQPWILWSNGDDRLRVQINDHALAKEFAKVKGTTQTGYSVIGAFTAIFVTQHSHDWVTNWMREHNQTATVKASSAPKSPTNP
jgi:hypothetical protein